MKLVFNHLTHPLNRTKVTNRYLQCKGKPTACNITLLTAAKLISHFLKTLLNLNVMQFYLFQPNVPFQYSLKTPERLWFYDVFRGYKNWRLCVKVSWYSQNITAGFRLASAHWAITCSKLSIETLEQGVKYVQSLW